MTLRDQTLIGQLIDSVIDSVYQRWLAFQSAFKGSGGRVGTYERERDALSLALREGNKVMREARAG
nr:hypothetical protein [Kibdelosporangium sp. MJ126-NF4]